MESSGAPVPLNIGEGVVGKETEVTERETIKSVNWRKKRRHRRVHCLQLSHDTELKDPYSEASVTSTCLL